MKNDPEKHADEFEDFGGANVFGYTLSGPMRGCIVQGVVLESGKVLVEDATMADSHPGGAPAWIRAH